jgi:hypothetical protein
MVSYYKKGLELGPRSLRRVNRVCTETPCTEELKGIDSLRLIEFMTNCTNTSLCAVLLNSQDFNALRQSKAIAREPANYDMAPLFLMGLVRPLLRP